MRNRNKFCLLVVAALLWPPVAYAADDAKEIESAPAQKEEAPKPSVNIPLADGMAAAYLSGQFAKTSGDIETSIRYLREAHRSSPQNTEISLQLQSMLLLGGHVEEAILLAESTPKSTGNAISALLVSLHAVKQGDIDRADIVLSSAFDSASGQLWLPLVTAWLDAARQRLPKPLAMEGMNADLGRAGALVQYHLALINAYAGFTDAAAQNFKNAIDDPANPPAHVMDMLIRFYNDNKAPAILRPVVGAYHEANPGNAAVGSTTAIASPQDGIAEVLFTMGSIMQGAGIPQDAVIYLQLTHYLKPNFPLATLGLGDAYGDFKQYEKANVAYASLPESDPLYNKAALRIAFNYNQMGKLREALALLDKISRTRPDHYEALVAKGDLLRSHTQCNAAVEAYSQALTRIVKPETQHWPILFARGVCFERQGKWKDAERDMQQALSLKPDQPDVLNYLGYTWLTRRERVEEARDMVEKAVRMRPNDPQIVDSMGWALFSLKQYDDAAAYLEKALELLPGDPTINDHLGDVYWQLGRKTEARFQWERSLSFLPEEADAEIIRKKLKAGISAATPTAAPVVADGSHPDPNVP